MLSDKMSRGSAIFDPRKLEAHIPNPDNGSNVSENLAAVSVVYPTWPANEIHAFRGSDVVESLLVAGRGFALTGRMDRMPTHLKRWDPAFGAHVPALHAVYIQRDGKDAEIRWDAHNGKFVWWMDPLATAGYPGEWVELATALSFIGTDQSAYGQEGSAVTTGGGPVQPIENDVLAITSQVVGTCSLSVGRGLFDLAGHPLTTVSVAQVAPSPFEVQVAGNKYRAIEVQTGGVLQLCLVAVPTFTAGSTADCSAAIAADRAKARITYG